MESNLIIKNGKFYRDNIEVKPEFGNVEQINCKINSDLLRNEGVKCNPVWDYEEQEVTIKINCLCGNNLYIVIDDLDDEIIRRQDIDIFEGESKMCPRCGLIYYFNIKNNKNLFIKLA